jgi:predicted AlkP superfamily phosphohydrolase/phosphomutase
MKRREFVKNTGLLLAASPFMNFAAGSAKNKKMMVLGIDGMDPGVGYRLMQQGKLPHMQQLAEQGTFTMMRTTIPPQSPVAWGSFTTGTDPGGYGVYDFLHRDPATYFPFSSQAETTPAKNIVKLGKYRIPLTSSDVKLLRQGKPFWNYLEERDIPATLFKLPGNYPPSETDQRSISGLGTPSVNGDDYGTYILYTSDEVEAERDVSPNKIYYAYVNEDNVMEDGVIEGPVNDLVENGEVVEIPFKVYVDYTHKTARIDVQGQEILIAEKELSDWVEVEFPLIKGISSLTGMVQFYLLELGERFRLYVSPVHISPAHPALTISTPSSYSTELADKVGLFHTISLPSATKPLQHGVFSMENFLEQHLSVHRESEKIFAFEFERFLQQKQGLLFFYFSTLDLGQHMMWVLNDKDHPFYHPQESQRFGAVRDELYIRHDRVLGEALKRLPSDVAVIVMSDHGFGPYRRQVNLNNWLFEEGYLKVEGGEIFEEMSILEYADWGNTRAYFLGLNGFYLNMKGREAQGIVTRQERRQLLEELKAKLEAITDPQNGQQVISTAYICEDHFSGDYLDRAPDIIIGYQKGYRSEDVSAMGSFSSRLIGDNMDWWSGDHLIDPKWVPASFLANFKISQKVPAIKDVSPTILKYFGIDKFPTMTGKSLI